MLILKASIVVAILVGVVLGIKRFNEHCRCKFGHSFFSKKAFYWTALALCLLVTGNLWRASAEQQQGDTHNGTILMVVGIAVALWLVYVNVKQTNLIYGIGGSVLQISVFSLLAWVSIPVLALVLLCQFLVLAAAKPVYIINR